MPKLPDDCETMADVRQGVDTTDHELLALFAKRFGYMRAAARIKPDRASVRDEPRKASVIFAAMAEAKELGLPDIMIGQMWEILVEGSIAYEFARWDDHARDE